MNKLHTILLIDDDPATNFLHNLIIQKENCTANIICKQSAEEALVYLRSKVKGEYPHPELIFLDINMPGMNGWEFLNEYKNIEKIQEAGKILVMLTTSLDFSDRDKAGKIKEITQFKTKPLTSEIIRDVLTTNFSKTFG